MSLHYDIALPQGWAMELAGIKDHVQASEL